MFTATIQVAALRVPLCGMLFTHPWASSLNGLKLISLDENGTKKQCSALDSLRFRNESDNEMTFIVPPQLGHFKESTSYTHLINAAQLILHFLRKSVSGSSLFQYSSGS